MQEAQHIDRKEFLGHPVGLYILFFTELWERFSYYGMRAILVLYIASSASGDNPGLGWKEADALTLYGWYTMLVYVMSIPGGIIADKWLGQKRTVLFGGLLLCAGHMILAVEQMWAFYAGLLLIVLGVGGLKPNISSMVGGLYPPGDERRDKGFTIFYIGINVGALLAAIIVGYVGETIGWHYGFGLAGGGMLLGQAVFMLGQRYLKGVGDKQQSIIKTDSAGEDAQPSNMFVQIFRHQSSGVVTSALIVLGAYIAIQHHIGYGILVMALSLGVGVLMVVYRDVTETERDRLTVIIISFGLIIVFWGAFEQAGGLMNIYTLNKIDRDVMGYEIPASVFQSVNAFFIIVFGTLVANFWIKWKRMGKESSSLFKMAIGTIVMGAGFIFMAIASKQAGSDLGSKGMLIMLIMAYLLHTLGELSSSPVALSFVTKLAPAKYVSIMMGFYFAATGLGNKVAGEIGSASKAEVIETRLTAERDQISGFVHDTIIEKNKNFELDTRVVYDNGDLRLVKAGEDLLKLVSISEENRSILEARIKNDDREDLNAILKFERDKDAPDEYKGTVKGYKGEIVIFEQENDREFKTFMLIFAFAAAFGFLVIIFLKKLKKLTHGAEDKEGTAHEEQEGFEIADDPDAEE